MAHLYIRIDADVKKKLKLLCSSTGTDTSSMISLFARTAIQRQKERIPFSATAEYASAMSFINTAVGIIDCHEHLTKAEKYGQKIEFYDYILATVKRDLLSELLASFIYCKDPPYITAPLPIGYSDRQGNYHSFAESKAEYKDISLKGDTVISIPWNRERIVNALPSIAETGFVFHSENHLSDYYTGLDLYFVYNGLHSTAAGIHYRSGHISSKIKHTEKIYPHYDTDGEVWINRHTGKTDKLDDFRIGILYETARKKYNMQRPLD